MNSEMIYSAINAGVLPAWALLAIAPKWSVTRMVVHSGLYPLAYGAIYASLLVWALFFGAGAEGAGFDSLAGVKAIFQSDAGALTGWTHYLVFDLFVGAWIGRDALKRGVSHFIVVPALFFTLMFGPIGLLFYVVARIVAGKGGWPFDPPQAVNA